MQSEGAAPATEGPAASARPRTVSDRLKAFCDGIAVSLGGGWTFRSSGGSKIGFDNGILSRPGGPVIEASALPGEYPWEMKVLFCPALPRTQGTPVMLRDTGVLGPDESEPAATLAMDTKAKQAAEALRRRLIGRLEEIWPGILAGLPRAKALARARTKGLSGLAALSGGKLQPATRSVEAVINGVAVRLRVDEDGSVRFDKLKVPDVRTAKAVLRALGAAKPDADGIGPGNDDPA